MTARIEVTIKDTMAFWDDYLSAYTFDPNGYAPTNTYVYLVPDDWLSGGTLEPDALERVYAHLYGATWRQGNGDGSRYQVLETRARVLPADDPREARPLGA